uniref:Uncharacterized protein n=1 Tax=Rhizophora mucronata TaxID=61149 RepID=A0A2P2P8D5_RHIMU
MFHGTNYSEDGTFISSYMAQRLSIYFIINMHGGELRVANQKYCETYWAK